MHLSRSWRRRHREQLPEVQREVISKGFVRVRGAQRRKDGSTYPVDLTVSMTNWDGAPAFMACPVTSPSGGTPRRKRRRLEEQLQHAVKMNPSPAGRRVAHDFNNLLTAILWQPGVGQSTAAER